MIPTKPACSPNQPPAHKTFWAIAGLILMGVIFAMATGLARLTLAALGSLVDTASFAQQNAVMKSFMLLLTLVTMWVMHRKAGLYYGFSWGENLSYGRFTRWAVILGFIGLLSVVVLNVIHFVLTKKPPVGFPPENLVSRILFIWVWSSLVEEVLFRGLFQSMVCGLDRTVFTIRKAPLTMAVLLSGGAFACLHLTLLFQGMDWVFVMGIFINTLLLGLLSGYLREKTGSLIPAIYVHIIFNIVGSSPLLLQSLLAS